MKSFKLLLATLFVALGYSTIQAADTPKPLFSDNEFTAMKNLYFSQDNNVMQAILKILEKNDKIYAIQFTIKNQLADLVPGVNKLPETTYYTEIIKQHKDTLNPLIQAVQKHLATKGGIGSFLLGSPKFTYAITNTLKNLNDEQKQSVITVYALLLAKFLLLTPEEQLQQSDLYLNTLTEKLSALIKDTDIETTFFETLSGDTNSFYSYLISLQEKKEKQHQEAKAKAAEQAAQEAQKKLATFAGNKDLYEKSVQKLKLENIPATIDALNDIARVYEFIKKNETKEPADEQEKTVFNEITKPGFISKIQTLYTVWACALEILYELGLLNNKFTVNKKLIIPDIYNSLNQDAGMIKEFKEMVEGFGTPIAEYPLFANLKKEQKIILLQAIIDKHLTRKNNEAVITLLKEKVLLGEQVVNELIKIAQDNKLTDSLFWQEQPEKEKPDLLTPELAACATCLAVTAQNFDIK